LKTAGAQGINQQVEDLLLRVRSEGAKASAELKKYATRDEIYVALGHDDLHAEPVLEYLFALLPAEAVKVAEETSDEVRQGYYTQNEVEDVSRYQLATDTARSLSCTGYHRGS
jgi:hypothetical protein